MVAARARALLAVVFATTIAVQAVDESLCDLARRGDTEGMIKAMNKGDADVDATDVYGWTPLFWAVDVGKVDAVRALLKNGADPLKGRNGWNALMWAAGGQHAESICKVMLEEFKLDPNSASENGLTALMVAAKGGKLPVVKMLLDAGAAVDKVDGDGASALMMSAGEGRLEVVQELGRRGASLTRKGSNGWTPLVWAAANWHTPVVEYIIGEVPAADLATEDNHGQSVLEIAAERGHAPVVRLLLQSEGVCGKDHITASLFRAAGKGRGNVVKELIEAGGAAPAGRDAKGWTPLMHAAAGGHAVAAEALIQAGASASEGCAEDSHTPLELAQLRVPQGARPEDALVKALGDRVRQAIRRVDPERMTSVELTNWVCTGSAAQCAVSRALAAAGMDGADAFGTRLPLEESLLRDGYRLVKWAVQLAKVPGMESKAPAFLAAVLERGSPARLLVDPPSVFRAASAQHQTEVLLQLASLGAVAPDTLVGEGDDARSALHAASAFPNVYDALRPAAEVKLSSTDPDAWSTGDVGLWLVLNGQSWDLVRAFESCGVDGKELVDHVLLPPAPPPVPEEGEPDPPEPPVSAAAVLLNGTDSLASGERLLRWAFEKGHVAVAQAVLKLHVGGDAWQAPVGPRGEPPMLLALVLGGEWSAVAEQLQLRVDARLRSTPPGQWTQADIACWLHSAGAEDLVAAFGESGVGGRQMSGLVGWPPAAGAGPARAAIRDAPKVLAWAASHSFRAVAKAVVSWANDVTDPRGLAVYAAMHATLPGDKAGRTLVEAASELGWPDVVAAVRPAVLARLLSLPVASWTPADTANWLVATGSSHLAPAFRQAGLGGSALSDLGISGSPSGVDAATGEVSGDPLKDVTRVLRWSLGRGDVAPVVSAVLASHPEPSLPAWPKDSPPAPSPYELANELGLAAAVSALHPRAEAELGRVPLPSWTVSHVANWLITAGLGVSAENFRKSGVMGRDLRTLATVDRPASEDGAPAPPGAEDLARAVVSNLSSPPRLLAWALEGNFFDVAQEAVIDLDDALDIVRPVAHGRPTLIEIATSSHERRDVVGAQMVQLLDRHLQGREMSEWTPEEVAGWLASQGAMRWARPFSEDGVTGEMMRPLVEEARAGPAAGGRWKLSPVRTLAWAMKGNHTAVTRFMLENHREVLNSGLEGDTLLGTLVADGVEEELVNSHVVPAVRHRLSVVAEGEMTPTDVANWVHLFGQPDKARALYLAGVDGPMVESMRKPGEVGSMFTEESLVLAEPEGMLEWAVTKGAAGLVKGLLQAGARAGPVDKFGNSLLITAAWNGKAGVVSALIEHGAPVNHANSNGFTALMRASLRGHEKCVRALLEAGADKSAQNSRGRTAMDLAKDDGVISVLSAA